MKSPMTPRTLELFKQHNSGNGFLDLVAPEVFYQIMVYLQPKDIRMCMCVSKKWKVSVKIFHKRAKIVKLMNEVRKVSHCVQFRFLEH